MKIILLILSAVLTGCLQTGDNNVKNKIPFPKRIIGDEFEIAYGQTIVHEAYDLEISFDRIEESRCPPEVLCFWEGDAVVSLRIKNLDNQQQDTVKIGLFGNLAPRLVFIDNVQLELVEVNFPAQLDDYVAKIKIRGPR